MGALNGREEMSSSLSYRDLYRLGLLFADAQIANPLGLGEAVVTYLRRGGKNVSYDEAFGTTWGAINLALGKAKKAGYLEKGNRGGGGPHAHTEVWVTWCKEPSSGEEVTVESFRAVQRDDSGAASGDGLEDRGITAEILRIIKLPEIGDKNSKEVLEDSIFVAAFLALVLLLILEEGSARSVGSESLQRIFLGRYGDDTVILFAGVLGGLVDLGYLAKDEDEEDPSFFVTDAGVESMREYLAKQVEQDEEELAGSEDEDPILAVDVSTELSPEDFSDEDLDRIEMPDAFDLKMGVKGLTAMPVVQATILRAVLCTTKVLPNKSPVSWGGDVISELGDVWKVDNGSLERNLLNALSRDPYRFLCRENGTDRREYYSPTQAGLQFLWNYLGLSSDIGEREPDLDEGPADATPVDELTEDGPSVEPSADVASGAPEGEAPGNGEETDDGIYGEAGEELTEPAVGIAALDGGRVRTISGATNPFRDNGWLNQLPIKVVDALRLLAEPTSSWDIEEQDSPCQLSLEELRLSLEKATAEQDRLNRKAGAMRCLRDWINGEDLSFAEDSRQLHEFVGVSRQAALQILARNFGVTPGDFEVAASTLREEGNRRGL